MNTGGLEPKREPDKVKLLDQVREVIRLKHYSIRTEESYVGWIRKFILFHGKRHPAEMKEAEVRAFLSHLANQGNVTASTQNQAFSALLFLYRHVLKQELGQIEGVDRAKRSISFTLSPDSRRGERGVVSFEGYRMADGQSPLWRRAAVDGVPSVAGEGPRFQLTSGGCPGW